jgi:UDP-N-acetylglucosamine 4,6-dehydratase
MLKNKKILITGGTGSLGKALTRELYKNNKIVIYSRNEERQFEMQKLFDKTKNIDYKIGDVRDTYTLKQALSGCDIAIHAAAMKDVIMCEKQPTQTYLNNIEGSRSFIEAVLDTPSVKKIVGISTDKASSPSNVYGMTKYIMEKLFIEANNFSDKKFSCARFGNMIDSSGSIISYWKNNPEAEIKLTDPRMERFFFTSKDAVKTVLDTINSGNGDVLIPKMKKAKIIDILMLITKKHDFPIIGITPGEKIYEELISENESHMCKENDNYYILNPKNNTSIIKSFSTKNAGILTKSELKKMIYEKE